MILEECPDFLAQVDIHVHITGDFVPEAINTGPSVPAAHDGEEAHWIVAAAVGKVELDNGGYVVGGWDIFTFRAGSRAAVA